MKLPAFFDNGLKKQLYKTHLEITYGKTYV
jgi:hypothetical protein